jgi:hypothetical protein
MATRFLDTGEAYLSPADKQYARVIDVPVHLSSSGGFDMPPAIVTLLLGLAVVGLGAVAFMI